MLARSMVRLHIVNRRRRRCRTREGRMRGHVTDLFSPDIDDPAIAQAFEVFRTGSQH